MQYNDRQYITTYRYYSFWDLLLIARDLYLSRFGKQDQKNYAAVRLQWAALRDSALRKEKEAHEVTRKRLFALQRELGIWKDKTSTPTLHAIAADIADIKAKLTPTPQAPPLS